MEDERPLQQSAEPPTPRLPPSLPAITMEAEEPPGSPGRLCAMVARSDQTWNACAGQHNTRSPNGRYIGFCVVEQGGEEGDEIGRTGPKGWLGILLVRWGVAPGSHRLTKPR